MSDCFRASQWLANLRPVALSVALEQRSARAEVTMRKAELI